MEARRGPNPNPNTCLNPANELTLTLTDRHPSYGPVQVDVVGYVQVDVVGYGETEGSGMLRVRSQVSSLL